MPKSLVHRVLDLHSHPVLYATLPKLANVLYWERGGDFPLLVYACGGTKQCLASSLPTPCYTIYLLLTLSIFL